MFNNFLNWFAFNRQQIISRSVASLLITTQTPRSR